MTEEPPENERKEAPQELPEVEPASGQDRVHTIPLFPFQVVPIHPVVGFEVREDRLDRRPSFQPPSDRRVLFPRQVHVDLRHFLRRAPVSTIDKRVRDLPSRHLLRLFDGPLERVSVARVAVKRPDPDHPVLLRRGDHRDLAAELVLFVRLPLRDALGFRRVHRVHLRGVLPFLAEDPLCRHKKIRKPRGRGRTFPLQIPDHTAQVGSKFSRLALAPLPLAGMGVTALTHKRFLPHQLVALHRSSIPSRFAARTSVRLALWYNRASVGKAIAFSCTVVSTIAPETSDRRSKFPRCAAAIVSFKSFSIPSGPTRLRHLTSVEGSRGK